MVSSKLVQCRIGHTQYVWFDFVKCLFDSHFKDISHKPCNVLATVFSLKCLIAILERHMSFVTLHWLIRHYGEANIFKLTYHMYALLLTNMFVQMYLLVNCLWLNIYTLMKHLTHKCGYSKMYRNLQWLKFEFIILQIRL